MTAELALVLPVLVLVLAVGLGAMAAGIDQVRCVDAARAGARAAARGDTPTAVRDVALRGAPEGARVDVLVGADSVTVTVTAPPRAVAGLPGLPAARATATATVESGHDR